MTMIAILVGGLGSVIGSFLNVVVHRVPAGRSVAYPASACPECGAAIRAKDNIPIVSWLLLRGRCRDCAAPISARYPLVELGTAIGFALVALGWLPSVLSADEPRAVVAASLELIAFLYLAGASIALAIIDLETHTLPNRIVVPTIVVMAAMLIVAGILIGDPYAIARSLIGGGALFLFYLVLAVSTRGGMGFGDVKLAAALGIAMAWMGWPAFAVGALSAFVLGGLASIVLLALGKVGRRSAIPFGPWMIGAAWVGIVFGAPIAEAYLKLAGL